MNRFCLVVDLKDEPALIQEYEKYHENVWPEIKQSITDAHIINMEIYRAANRLFMIMETTDDFSFDKKAQMDAANEKVQEWEKLMWKFQQPLAWANEGEKWVITNKIFSLH